MAASRSTGFAAPEAPLLGALTAAVAEAAGGTAELAVLFSGGLDSSLLAWLVPAGVRVVLVAVGTETAPDLVAAREGAALLGRSVEVHVLRDEDIQAAWVRWGPELAGLREPARSVSLAFAMATEAAPPGRVLCGQGADELFYGYAHFRALGDEPARHRSQSDLRILEDRDWPRALRIGRSIGRELRAPYLDPRVRALASDFPVPVPGEPPKITLRRVASIAGLPPALVERPKRALQYGSGVARRVERIVRYERSPGR
jgi:asparagine synthase (glutamine-hydrolysing)